MIIENAWYECKKCKKWHFFETSKPYSKICPQCGEEMEFKRNVNCDTELAEKVKNTPPYDPTKDPNSSYYIPVVKCPYCGSMDVNKIGTVGRAVSVGLLGLASDKIGKTHKCNKCGSTW